MITFADLTENLGFELQQVNHTSQAYKYTESTPNWIYNINYWYWTSSQYNSLIDSVWVVGCDGILSYDQVNSCENIHFSINGVVRPVITIKKSVLEN